jgi:hypothetical protein
MEDELNERERDALAKLPRDVQPSTALHDHVIDDLRKAGLLRRSRGAMFLALAAAVIAGFVGGLLLPQLMPHTQHREFILFVHSTPQMRADGAEPQRVVEYSRWARDLRARGQLSGGEKLTDDITTLGPNARQSDVGGFFRIVARDRAEAQAIARTCQHLRYGGWIEIREIDHV